MTGEIADSWELLFFCSLGFGVVVAQPTPRDKRQKKEYVELATVTIKIITYVINAREGANAAACCCC